MDYGDPVSTLKLMHDVLSNDWIGVTRSPFGASAMHDPDTDELVFYWQPTSMEITRARCYDTTSVATTVRVEAFSSDIIPLSENHSMEVMGNQVMFFDSTGRSVTVANPVPLPHLTVFMRLRSDEFLAWREDNTCRCIRLYRFEADWRTNRVSLVQTAELNATVPTADVYPIENPADGSVIVLVGGDGVVAHVLSTNLQTQRVFTVVPPGHRCARPSGLILGDTLFAAWEDYRTSVSDVYATAVDLRRGAAAGDRDRTAVVCWPLPADASLRVEFITDAAGPAHLDLIDVSGRVVLTHTLACSAAGRCSASITTSELMNGAYVARVRTASSVATAQVLVFHEQ
jgi:hypothetical protein